MNTEELALQAEACGVPFVRAVGKDVFAPELLGSLPVRWAREQCVLPVRIGGVPSLLMPSADAMDAIAHASLVSGEPLQPAFAPEEEIRRAIEEAYFEKSGAERRDDGAVKPSGRPRAHAAAGSGEDLLAEKRDPVERFLNETVLDAVRSGASDVHFEPDDSGALAVRFRISGRLYGRRGAPDGMRDALVARAKVLARMDLTERRLPQDGMASFSAGGRAVDVRVSTVPVTGGERVVMRLLNRDDSLRPLSSLGMTPSVAEAFDAMLASPNGIIAVSGPTGSGKTTSLYSAIGSLDSAHRNVMTVEDPVEYRLPGIAQIQIKPKIGLTFASGLRHILRQDPDVILVGETRDPETAEIAVRAALTGHLVFTTLHTNDALSAPARLADLGVEPYLLASCLRGVLSQRLVRVLCGCARTLPAGSAEFTAAERALLAAAECGTARAAAGCPRCLEGYSGRVGVFETLAASAAVREAIHAREFDSASLRKAAGGAFIPMKDDAFAKLRAGTTSPAETLSAVGSGARV